MYHAFVRARTRRAFADLSAGDVTRHLSRFADDAALADRTAERRRGMSRIRLAWGRVVEEDLFTFAALDPFGAPPRW
ncbi:hypothetical protein [Acuticoccus sp.]|uniref:hypothetical protein n=1 Tax=Acuticoccus sp. TaxID=1904378 RepID=UPI003B52BC79